MYDKFVVLQLSLSFSSILQAGVPIQEAMLAAEKNRTNRVSGMKQPGLILIGSETWLKLDRTPIKLQVSCLAEAVGYLLATFYAFNCEYPPSLKLVYGFLEKCAGIVPSVTSPNSTVLDEFYWGLIRHV